MRWVIVTETWYYLYTVLVTLAIASAALIGARYEDRGLPLAKTAYLKLRARLAGLASP